VKLSHEDIAEIEVLTDVIMATIFLACNIWSVHWHHLANTSDTCVAAMRPYVKVL